MTRTEFISALVDVVHNPSVADTIEGLASPPGRRPASKEVELARWYGQLAPDDRARLRMVVEHAVHATLFGVLSVLDGVRTIDASNDAAELQLIYKGGATSVHLNASADEPLHDIYQGLVYEHVFGREP